MSMKIWEAYRLKPDYDVWDTSIKIRAEGQKRIQESLRTLIVHSKPRGMQLNDRSESDRLYTVDRYFLDRYREQLGKYERDPFDFDCSITVRRHEGRWIFIPYGTQYGFFRGCLSFLDDMPELEDYHYQNQSDPPDPEPENWQERARVWNDIADNSWADYLVLEICTYERWNEVSPWALYIKEKIQRAK